MAPSIVSTEHALYCFDVLNHHLASPTEPAPKPSFPGAETPYAIFVTYETLRLGKSPRLRGCIGQFTPFPLGKQLAEYAIVAAIKDSRFHPITSRELSTLQCEVSILTPFEPCSDPFDWDLGTHGIYITVRSSSRKYTATYLPHVAPEQGWTKEETLQSALEKAGFRGRLADVWSQERGGDQLVVQKYRSEKLGVTHAEWLEARKAVV